MVKKYFIKTFGCQMNVYDSHRMAKMLEEMGLEETSVQEEADVVVFNTCHIREKAAEKVFSDLGRAYIIKQGRLEKGFGVPQLPKSVFALLTSGTKSV